jgi:uncharacterized protein (DUF1499 family)
VDWDYVIVRKCKSERRKNKETDTMTIRKSIMMIAGFLFFGMTIGNPALSSGESGGKNRLGPCPASPNCVSSVEPGKGHFIPPLNYAGTPEAVYGKLLRILESLPRVRIVEREKDYLHAEFKSGGFGFVDDVEFFFPSDASVIHVRSASRKGYYDFGVNRRRIEGLRKRLAEAPE